MSDSEPNLVLIGLRGSGKSTIGARLAQALGRGFVDLDDSTARALQCAGAGEAIANHGMDAFRAAERTALEQELQTARRVVALGGGTPTAEGCAELLAQDPCRVIYLKAQPCTLRARLSSTDNTDRPSLTGGDVLDEIGTVYEQRDPLYMEIAESVVHTDGVSEDSTLVALLALVRAGV
jgi:shikimate kinase